jgi:hypothetical protein
MKTFKIIQLFWLLALASTTLVSCLKSDLPTAQSYNLAPSPTQVEASLTDMGLVNDTTRKLLVMIRGLKYELSNEYGTFLQSGSFIQVGFFSNTDGFIPSGKYNHLDTTFKVPFTFNDAFLRVGGYFISITNGSITVNSEGNSYTILFECGLSDGETFTATYKGAIMDSGYYN